MFAPVNHWRAKKMALAMRNSAKGATYGLRIPAVQASVSFPGWRSRHSIVRKTRSSASCVVCPDALAAWNGGFRPRRTGR